MQTTWPGTLVTLALLLQGVAPGKPCNGSRKVAPMKVNENKAIKKPDSSKAKSTSSVEPIQLPPSFKGAFKFGKVCLDVYIIIQFRNAVVN